MESRIYDLDASWTISEAIANEFAWGVEKFLEHQTQCHIVAAFEKVADKAFLECGCGGFTCHFEVVCSLVCLDDKTKIYSQKINVKAIAHGDNVKQNAFLKQ